jgi:hypothetical protein
LGGWGDDWQTLSTMGRGRALSHAVGSAQFWERGCAGVGRRSETDASQARHQRHTCIKLRQRCHMWRLGVPIMA